MLAIQMPHEQEHQSILALYPIQILNTCPSTITKTRLVSSQSQGKNGKSKENPTSCIRLWDITQRTEERSCNIRTREYMTMGPRYIQKGVHIDQCTGYVWCCLYILVGNKRQTGINKGKQKGNITVRLRCLWESHKFESCRGQCNKDDNRKYMEFCIDTNVCNYYVEQV